MILDVIFLNLGLKRCRQEFFYLLVTDRKAPHQTSWLQLMTTQKVPELIGSVPGPIGVSYQTWGLGYVGLGTGYEGPGGVPEKSITFKSEVQREMCAWHAKF